MLFNGLSPVHLVLLLIVVVLLFGGKKLPGVARGVGQSLRILKAEMGAKDETPSPTKTEPESPQHDAGGSSKPQA